MPTAPVRAVSALPTTPQWLPLGELKFKEQRCPVCKTGEGKPFHNKTIAGYEMHFWLCDICDALYARNPVADRSLRSMFGSKDFFASGEPGVEHIDYYDFIGGEKYLRATARARIKRIRQYKPDGHLLEVASAAGFFLIEAKNAGYDVQGVEISPPMASYASARWSVPVIEDSIETIDFPAATFDVIASWGVMTLLRDPVEAVRKYHRILKPGGVWAFNTYYHDCLWHRLVGRRWSILAVQTNQTYSTKLLIGMVSNAGFKLLSRRRDRPYSDLMKIADHLTYNTGWTWLVRVVEKFGLRNVIVRIPLPDVYEYVWQKQ
jgi:SAM-dependent methyltransferase